MNVIDAVGYFGITMMFLCFVPQLYRTIKSGNADGVTLGYLVMGAAGMFSLFFYVLLGPSRSTQLMINYAYNCIAFCMVLKYKLWPRTK